MIEAIFIYVVGAVLAYGLFMGMNKEFEDVLGISRGDIAASLIWGILSWVGVFCALADHLVVWRKPSLCWQLCRSYPTSSDPFHRGSYIRKHGEIKRARHD